MIDEPLVRFTAHQLPRQELHPLMARSDGPALRRAAAHLGALAVTGALLWHLRATGWALPLLVATITGLAGPNAAHKLSDGAVSSYALTAAGWNQLLAAARHDCPARSVPADPGGCGRRA